MLICNVIPKNMWRDHAIIIFPLRILCTKHYIKQSYSVRTCTDDDKSQSEALGNAYNMNAGKSIKQLHVAHTESCHIYTQSLSLWLKLLGKGKHACGNSKVNDLYVKSCKEPPPVHYAKRLYLSHTMTTCNINSLQLMRLNHAGGNSKVNDLYVTSCKESPPVHYAKRLYLSHTMTTCNINSLQLMRLNHAGGNSKVNDLYVKSCKESPPVHYAKRLYLSHTMTTCNINSLQLMRLNHAGSNSKVRDLYVTSCMEPPHTAVHYAKWL